MAQLPPNSVALYRILTEKSFLGFGQYRDLTVGDILNLDEDYIVWAYATCDKISLHKSIIERLGIREIPKPGHDVSVLYEYRDKKREGLTDEELLHGRVKLARRIKGRAISRMISVKNATHQSKARLQAINHGHMKAK